MINLQLNHNVFRHSQQIRVSEEIYVDYHSTKLLWTAVSRSHKVLQIRQAEESDICNLVDLDNECFDTYYYKKTKFSKSDFQAYLCFKKSILLVAVRDSRLVGYIAGIVRTSQVRSIAHLDSIAISSTARREGIGSRLLHLLIQEVKLQACLMVLLEVAKANKEGLSFFSKHGFRKIADLQGYYGWDLDGVLMQLSI